MGQASKTRTEPATEFSNNMALCQLNTSGISDEFSVLLTFRVSGLYTWEDHFSGEKKVWTVLANALRK